MTDANLTVYIVDDDASIRDSLGLLLGLKGYGCAPFASAEAFLSAWSPDWAGCLLADLRMPGMDGLSLQDELKRRGSTLPVVFITAHGDVAAARRAFRMDAVDFLEKPFDEETPLLAIEAAFDRERARLARVSETRQRESRLTSLTAREREVTGLLIQGVHNKEIGVRLGISPRTVEVHKARIMEKLGTRNLSDLIRIMARAERT